MVIYLSVLVALIGLLVYGYAANPKAGELGRIAFGCGLLAFLMTGGAARILENIRP